MEPKTFNDFLDESLTESTETEVETSEDLVIDESDTEVEGAELEENTEEVEETNDESTEEVETKEEKADFKAFAEMRTKNKLLAEEKEKAESEKQKAEALAKKLGYDNIDEMIEEATKREIESEAKKQGIPVELMTEMQTLKEKVRELENQKINEENERKERNLLNTIDSFVSERKLSENDQAKIFKALEEDGLEYEHLLHMPEKTVKRLLDACINKETNKQKELADKVKIQKEIPLTPNEKSSGADTSIEDDLFAYMSGQKRNF